MQRITVRQMLALLCTGMLATGSALADKPAWAGGGKSGKHQPQREAQPTQENETRLSVHFGDQQRAVANEYFAGQFRAGRCPPGLAKKRNGCMPPGQAKKWAMGKPLPQDVTYYDLPPKLVVQLGNPPAGHRYVRVASDILLIAVGTGMVVDAIEDLGRI